LKREASSTVQHEQSVGPLVVAEENEKYSLKERKCVHVAGGESGLFLAGSRAALTNKQERGVGKGGTIIKRIDQIRNQEEEGVSTSKDSATVECDGTSRGTRITFEPEKRWGFPIFKTGIRRENKVISGEVGMSFILKEGADLGKRR